MNEDNQPMRIDVYTCFSVGIESRKLGKLARKKSRRRCKECKTLLKRKYADKKVKTLFCSNKKCKKFLESV